MLHYMSLNNHHADINGNDDLCENLKFEVILPIFNFLSSNPNVANSHGTASVPT